jgi:NADPH2:quinone reductase
MRAVRVHSHGGPEVLSYEEVTTPMPGPGEARVKIAAVGVNFIDIYKRSGQYKGALPFTLGEEAAGVVDAIDPGVQDVRVGDRVAFAMQPGAYAEYAVVPAWKLVPVPSDVDLHYAAAVMLQGMTAHYLVSSTFVLGAGHTAVIHAAAGGVGGLLTQLAKLRGARVVATVSTAEKAALAREAGADEVVGYDDFAEAVRRITGGRGADVVYDSVGQATFEQSLSALRPRGYMVLYGQSSGAVPPLDPQVLNARGSLFLTRPTLAHYIQDRAELLGRAGELFELMADGRLRVRVDRSYPLAEAGAAQRALAGRETSGKVLLIP